MPERMINVDDIEILVRSVLNHTMCEIESAGSGASSTAWIISCNKDNYVLRVMPPNMNRPVTYRSEFIILKSLFNDGLPVPEPLLTSFSHPTKLHGAEAWAITRPVPGKPILKNKLEPSICVHIGQFLRHLHALPCSGFGRLVEEAETITGQQLSHIEGIRARWCWAKIWPFDDSLLDEHPIAMMQPDLFRAISALQEDISQCGQANNVVLNHADLYGEHIFIHNGRLSGIIDFGAAFIGVAGWDFAVIAFYHGWNALKTILEHYAHDESDYSYLLRQSQLLAIAVGLYKLDKAVTANRATEKLQRVLRFLSETIDAYDS